MRSLVGYRYDRKRRSNLSPGDMISSLPDDLLCHVLSFLSTKEAALTSVLSRRWSNLLQFVPNLDLDDSVLLNPKKGQRANAVFVRFVDRLLSLRVHSSSPVHRVSLKLRGVERDHTFQAGVECERILQWVRTVIALSVFDLAFCVNFKSFHVSLDVFKSKTLVNLRIGTRISLFKRLPGLVSDVVKSLVLESVEFDDAEGGFEPILLAFPSLKDLRIYESNDWNYWNGSISSPTLESLTIRRDDDGFYAPKKTCVSFDTPSVVYLDYSDMVADKYESLKLDSLVEAKLDLLLNANQIMQRSSPISNGFVPGDVTPLFMSISHVKILCLSPDALETLYYRGERIPVFNNLISLSLGSDRPHGSPYIFWKMLPSLLLKSLNLETLIIKGLAHYVTEGWEAFCPGSERFPWNDVSDSLSSSAVKILKITRYQGTYQELNHMERFLGKLSRLEVLRIYHNVSNNGERCRLMKLLLHHPKASSKCKIRFIKEAA